jgi:hypothetical protein
MKPMTLAQARRLPLNYPAICQKTAVKNPLDSVFRIDMNTAGSRAADRAPGAILCFSVPSITDSQVWLGRFSKRCDITRYHSCSSGRQPALGDVKLRVSRRPWSQCSRKRRPAILRPMPPNSEH